MLFKSVESLYPARTCGGSFGPRYAEVGAQFHLLRGHSHSHPGREQHHEAGPPRKESRSSAGNKLFSLNLSTLSSQPLESRYNTPVHDLMSFLSFSSLAVCSQ